MLPNGTCAKLGMNQTQPVSLTAFAAKYLGISSVSQLASIAQRGGNSTNNLGNIDQVIVGVK